MTTIDQRLARKGKGQPRDAVLQQARVLYDLVITHQGDLAPHGWDGADTTRFAANIQVVQNAMGGRTDAGNQAVSLTSSERAALASVKAFLRRLRLALPRVLRDNPASGVTMGVFAVNDSVGRSTPKTIEYLINIRAAVVKLDGALQKHFGGKMASAELDAVKGALEQADTEQEVAQVAGPVETQALYAAVGQLLEDVEDIIRAGKSAFDGNAATRAKFNKDLILRARRGGSGSGNGPGAG